MAGSPESAKIKINETFKNSLETESFCVYCVENDIEKLSDLYRRFELMKGKKRRTCHECYNESMDNLQARDCFLSQLEAAENKSLASIKAYDSDIRIYLSWLEEQNLSFDQASRQDVENYLQSYCESHIQSSANRMLSCLRTFYRILCSINPDLDNPVSLIQGMKTPSKLPLYISEPQLKKLFESFGDSDRDLLDSCILMTLYSCGLRVGELCSLNLNDVHLNQKQLKVFGKRSKERIVPLNDLCIEKMKEYLLYVRNECRDPHFFLNLQGRPLNRQYVDRLIKKKSAELGLNLNLSAHSFRHSFATSLLSGKADLRAVQELLGHADIRTTQIYTHVESERLKQVYDQALPDPFQKGSKK